MSRFLAKLLCPILLSSLVVGCTRQCFLVKEELDSAALPPNIQHLETEHVTSKPVVANVPTPATVKNAERPARYITLPESIAYALENGTVGSQGAQNGTGVPSTNFVGYTGGSLASQSDSIRVLAYNPAEAFANMESSDSRFDAQWVSSLRNTSTDELAGTANPSPSNGPNGTSAQYTNTIFKPLAGGGVISTTLGAGYQNFIGTTSGQLNPLWTTYLRFGFEQPLWQNYGVEINQLLDRISPISGYSMPSDSAAAYSNRRGNSADGILIARLRFDSQRAEFERNINNLVINTEVAYWNLYEAYGELYSYEELMRLAHKVWMIYYENFTTGAQKGSVKNYAPILAKYEELRGNRLAALGKVLDAERNLRGVMGLPVEDGDRLVPITPPTMASFQPDWKAALQDAMALKPELVLARENVRLAQLNLETQKNYLKPDLRFSFTYQPTGFGTGLFPTGTGQMLNGNGNPISNGAFQSLAGNHFNDWTAGLVLSMPIGYRAEHAAVRQARLNLGQAYELLRDQEMRAQRHLVEQYQKVAEWHERIGAAKAERKTYGDALQAFIEEIRVGRDVPSSDFLVVSGQLSQAMLKQFGTISEYNNTLARWEWAKGTLLPFNNIHIAERPLPGCIEERATQHQREATKALVLRQHPDVSPLTHPGRLANDPEGKGEPQTLAEPAASKQNNQPSLSPPDAWNAQTRGEPVSATPQPSTFGILQPPTQLPSQSFDLLPPPR